MKDKPTTAPSAEFPANGNYGTVARFARAAKGFGISPADTNLLLDSLPEHVLGSMYAAERILVNDRHFADGSREFVSAKKKWTRAKKIPNGSVTPQDWRRGTEVLAAIPAETYIPILTGSEPLPGGRVSCPLPDHEDRNPSATYKDAVWFCHRCGEGGGIFTLAAAITGRRDHGDEFCELRKWVAEQMLGAAA